MGEIENKNVPVDDKGRPLVDNEGYPLVIDRIGMFMGARCSRCKTLPQKIGTLCVNCLEDDGIMQ